MAKGKGNVIGSWAFLIGVILAIVLALFSTISQQMAYILILIGIIAGLLNIADSEAMPFLLSGAVLIIASTLGQSVTEQAPLLDSVLRALLLIFVPATIIVAIRHVFSTAKK